MRTTARRDRNIYSRPVSEKDCKTVTCQECGLAAHYVGGGNGFDVFECPGCGKHRVVRGAVGPQRDHPCRDALVQQLRVLFPSVEVGTEFAFKKGRRWRADISIHTHDFRPSILIEIEGGTWSNGRHSRGSGYEKDLEKYNMGAEMGFIYLRYTPEMVQRGEALAQIERVLNG